jgi:hypothetical protein
MLTARLFNPLRCLQSDERGQTGILFLLTLMMTFGFMSIALDAGLWYLDHRLAQNQVDAAALAGAGYLKEYGGDPDEFENVRLEVVKYIEANRGTSSDLMDATDCVAPSGGWPTGTGISVDADPRATIITYAPVSVGYPWSNQDVRVCLRRTSPSLLSSLAGMTGIHVSAVASAKVKVQITEFALMAMDPENSCSDPPLSSGGGAKVSLDNGWTYTEDACLTNAININGGGNITTIGSHWMVGGTTNGPPNLTGTQLEQSENLPDPYESNIRFQQPSPPFTNCYKDNQVVAGQPSIRTMITAKELRPGCYADRLSIGNSDGIVFMRSGTYVFLDGMNVTGGSAGLKVLTTATDGVLLYFTCDANGCADNGSEGIVNAGINLSAGQNDLEPLSTNNNFLFWVDRNANANTVQPCTVTLPGNGSSSFQGRIYALHCDLTFAGSSATAGPLKLSIVASEIKFTGGTEYNIDYDDFPIPLFTMYLSE